MLQRRKMKTHMPHSIIKHKSAETKKTQVWAAFKPDIVLCKLPGCTQICSTACIGGMFWELHNSLVAYMLPQIIQFQSWKSKLSKRWWRGTIKLWEQYPLLTLYPDTSILINLTWFLDEQRAGQISNGGNLRMGSHLILELVPSS